MNWKKNAFSYLMWFLYTVMTCGMLSIAACSLCGWAGTEMYRGILTAVLFLAGAGVIVFLLHRFAAFSSFAAGKRRIFLLLEGGLAAALLIGGLVIRLLGLESIGQASDYYEVARVSENWEAPGTPHGAVYLYVQILHGAFVLLGNRFLVGIWLQIVLQLAALLVLFFTARKLAGSICALVILGFGACGPYMVGEALVLSPRVLYFLLFVTVAALTAAAARASGIRLFWLIGLLTAFCTYLDIAGVLLIFLNISVIFSRPREETDVGRKLAAAWRYVSGVFLGFLVCFLGDALLSGIALGQTLESWFLLYRPDIFSLPVADAWSGSVEVFLLFGFMAFGIFSFWCHRREEHITACMLGFCGITLAGCFGMFTEEMPGTLYIYLLLVLCAGLGLERSFARKVQEETGEKYSWEILIEKMEENESLRKAWEEETEGYLEDMDGEIQEIEEEPEDQETQEEPEDMEVEIQEEEIQYIENPLPLPKKHVKREMDFALQTVSEGDDFDYLVPENDDYDI